MLFFCVSGLDPISGGGKDDDHKTFQHLLQKYGKEMSHEEKQVLEEFASKLKQPPKANLPKKKPVENQPSRTYHEKEENEEHNNVFQWVTGILQGGDDRKELINNLEFIIAKDLQRLCKSINDGNLEVAKKQCHKLRLKYQIPPFKRITELDLSKLQSDQVSNDILYTSNPSEKGRLFTVSTTGNGSCFFHCLSTR